MKLLTSHGVALELLDNRKAHPGPSHYRMAFLECVPWSMIDVNCALGETFSGLCGSPVGFGNLEYIPRCCFAERATVGCLGKRGLVL